MIEAVGGRDVDELHRAELRGEGERDGVRIDPERLAIAIKATVRRLRTGERCALERASCESPKDGDLSVFAAADLFAPVDLFAPAND